MESTRLAVETRVSVLCLNAPIQNALRASEEFLSPIRIRTSDSSASEEPQHEDVVLTPSSNAILPVGTEVNRLQGGSNRERMRRPLGNVIDDKHEQYALTYGMMCGILNSAGRHSSFCAVNRLCMEDFSRVDKRDFPASLKLGHSFKFKDYSPDVFRHIRRQFCIDSADYMVTLCGDFNYIEFLANSKSGQFFFYSHDGRFMIKTQSKEESRFLRRILPQYYQYVVENPNTLLSRFYGMHRVKMHHLRKKMHFIIMANVFDTNLDIHARFDLKGAQVGRRTSRKDLDRYQVLKDVDLLESNVRLELGAANRKAFLSQLESDVDFLKGMNIMDYSLLVGIHDTRQGAIQKTVYDTLKRLNPVKELPASRLVAMRSWNIKSMPTTPVGGSLKGKGASSLSALDVFATSPAKADSSVLTRLLRSISSPRVSSANRKREADVRSPKRLTTLNTPEKPHSMNVPSDEQNHSFGRIEADIVSRDSVFEEEEMDSMEQMSFVPLSPSFLELENVTVHTDSIFAQHEGGISGRDAYGAPNGLVYFIGVIDILQQYNGRKVAETFIKGIRHDRKQISAVNPTFYGNRFLEFVKAHVV